jgi:AAA+ superfamily predicted ATPase
MTLFPDGKTHLRAELRRLDLLLHREIARLRAAHLLSGDDLHGLYVSDAQVDALVYQFQAQTKRGQSPPDVEALTTEAERLAAENMARSAANLPMVRLTALFDLEEFEREVLLLAVAPELDLRYEVLCTYLNNDVTRKRPTCDLALRLFCNDSEQRWDRHPHFAPDAPLFRCGLLRWEPVAPDTPASSLARSFHAPLRVVDYLLEIASNEPGLTPFTEMVSPRRRWNDLLFPEEFLMTLRGAPRLLDKLPAPVFVFEGHEGAGKRSCAEALCQEMGRALLLVVDVEALMTSQAELSEVLALLGREQRFDNAGLYFSRAEAFFDSDGRLLPKARSFSRSPGHCIPPIVLGCAGNCDLKALIGETPFHVFRLPTLPFPLRQQWWRRELATTFGESNGTDLDALANQFVLTGGQIHAAVQSARDHLRLRRKAGTLPSTTDLFAAARAQSQHGLRSLAQRIEPVHSWNDLVLPAPTLSQLREIASAVRHRHIVYTRWGFEQRLSLGKGLKSLFAGPSGTGKTMTADVMARELGLDLYKIDLSTVVSKYIGETEKNLDRIFRAAEASNAIIFFDEADALFGKRSEVKDAHDRYANIEVAYLLQKTDEYEGFVILATNLILNIDDAFKRRMNYTVEFPLPDEPLRERLWQTMFPTETPLGDDVDFAFLARQFPLSGGNIKNAALAAAFLAANNEGSVRMHHLIQAVAREWQKLGKLTSAADFKQYYQWVIAPSTEC